MKAFVVTAGMLVAIGWSALFVSEASALDLSRLLTTVTSQPVNQLLGTSGDRLPPSTSQQTSPTTSEEPPASTSDTQPIAEATSPLAVISTTTTMAIPTDILHSQLGEVPLSALPVYAKKSMYQLSLAEKATNIETMVIERTSNGWKIAGRMWYEWLAVGLVMTAAITTISHLLKRLWRQVLLS